MTRIEHDLIGNRDIPETALYGVHTLRALENFPISGIKISTYPHFITSLAMIKEAAALANFDLGLISQDKALAIIDAAKEICKGKHHAHFVVDVIQGGAGTSSNMNMNEVIANRGLELMGHKRGDYKHLHPINDVNLSQSTNDVYPTAIRLASILYIDELRGNMAYLKKALLRKANEFNHLQKIGRTQLQDAVPMTLGQEFQAFADTLQEDIDRLKEASKLLHEISLGATAIGTGILAHPDYKESVRKHLSKLFGERLITAFNLIEATPDVGAFVQLSGVLKRVAVKLSKTCNDLRLLSSGPRGGFGEITLPARQAGSSIMPGKINPVIPEVVNQIAFEVIGNDVTISFAAEGGQLQLNAFEPIIAHSLFKSLTHMSNGCKVLADFCIDGIKANVQRLHDLVEGSLIHVTSLNPIIGYEQATAISGEAVATGKTLRIIL
jgi:aspartate ammonia-lyase